MNKSKYRHRTQTYPNFFDSRNLSVDKVYNAKNNFWIAIPYRKIGRIKVIFWIKKNKNEWFILVKVTWGVGVHFSGAIIQVASIIRLVWKFVSILRLIRNFKIAMILDDRRRSLFDLPDFKRQNRLRVRWCPRKHHNKIIFFYYLIYYDFA